MRTAHAGTRHHPFGGKYAKDVTYRQGGDATPNYAPRVHVGAEKKPTITGKPRGLRTVEGCSRLAKILAQAPWDEQRDRLITTQPELEKHLKSHNLVFHHLT